MNHHKSVRKFNRTGNQRHALLKTLAVSLVMKEKIQTSEPKAKELRPFVEKLVSHAKKETLSSKRAILTLIGKVAFGKLVKDIAPRYKDRKGGYLRITKIGIRKSDASPRSQIEWV
jgi:large subunit ribosomal protein L17